MTDREQFEKWASVPPREWSTRRDWCARPGQYRDHRVQFAWKVWQAALADMGRTRYEGQDDEC